MFGYFLVGSLKNAYLQSTDATLDVIIKDISHDYTSQNDADGILGDAKEEFDIPTLYVQLGTIDKKKEAFNVISTSHDLKGEAIFLDAKSITAVLTSKGVVFTTIRHAKKTLRVAHMVIENDAKTPIVLSCALNYEYHTPYLKQLKEWLWIGLSSLLLFILLMVYFIISQSFLNVQRVIDEVRHVSIEETYIPIAKSHVSKEIDNLIDTFNALLAQLSHSYMQVKQFGHNASHELKTPLTIMRGEIEVGLKKERSCEEYQTILKTIHAEVKSLQTVIEKILFLSSVTKQGVHASFETVYLDELIHEVVGEKKALAKQKDVTLSIRTCEPFTLSGNCALLKILLTNLLDNAIKYSDNGTTVIIALVDEQVSIENKGVSIAEEEMPYIFDRFYRGKGVGSIEGSGLGLSLVKAIAEVHGLSTEVECFNEKCTRVILSV